MQVQVHRPAALHNAAQGVQPATLPARQDTIKFSGSEKTFKVPLDKATLAKLDALCAQSGLSQAEVAKLGADLFPKLTYFSTPGERPVFVSQQALEALNAKDINYTSTDYESHKLETTASDWENWRKDNLSETPPGPSMPKKLRPWNLLGKTLLELPKPIRDTAETVYAALYVLPYFTRRNKLVQSDRQNVVDGINTLHQLMMERKANPDLQLVRVASWKDSIVKYDGAGNVIPADPNKLNVKITNDLTLYRKLKLG